MTPLDLSWYDLGMLIVGPLVFMVGIGITIYLARRYLKGYSYKVGGTTITTRGGDREEMWMALTIGPVCSIAVALLAALIWPVLLAAVVLSIIPMRVMNFHISELFDKEKVNQ